MHPNSQAAQRFSALFGGCDTVVVPTFSDLFPAERGRRKAPVGFDDGGGVLSPCPRPPAAGAVLRRKAPKLFNPRRRGTGTRYTKLLGR
jgi:hypothetical protein